jgi:hypothetical protein
MTSTKDNQDMRINATGIKVSVCIDIDKAL